MTVHAARVRNREVAARDTFAFLSEQRYDVRTARRRNLKEQRDGG